MSDQAIPVFVINLPRATERRAAVERRMQAIGLAYEIVEAVDGRMLSPAELEVLCGPKRPFSPGEVGCYLSHMKVYRLIVERGVPVAAVLEDDAHRNPMVTELLVPGIRSDCSTSVSSTIGRSASAARSSATSTTPFACRRTSLPTGWRRRRTARTPSSSPRTRRGSG
jgi:hypothetical protein